MRQLGVTNRTRADTARKQPNQSPREAGWAFFLVRHHLLRCVLGSVGKPIQVVTKVEAILWRKKKTPTRPPILRAVPATEGAAFGHARPPPLFLALFFIMFLYPFLRNPTLIFSFSAWLWRVKGFA